MDYLLIGFIITIVSTVIFAAVIVTIVASTKKELNKKINDALTEIKEIKTQQNNQNMQNAYTNTYTNTNQNVTYLSDDDLKEQLDGLLQERIITQNDYDYYLENGKIPEQNIIDLWVNSCEDIAENMYDRGNITEQQLKEVLDFIDNYEIKTISDVFDKFMPDFNEKMKEYR